MNTAFLIIGGNLGNRRQTLQYAVEAIKKHIGNVQRTSSVYETEPWGVSNQPNYYNQVLEVHTNFDAHTLMQQLLSIEAKMGRQRLEKYSSRTIDLDILFYNHEIIHTEILQIPHPRLHLRRFVLVPMAEIAPELIHPVLQKNIKQLLQECEDSTVVKKI